MVLIATGKIIILIYLFKDSFNKHVQSKGQTNILIQKCFYLLRFEVKKTFYWKIEIKNDRQYIEVKKTFHWNLKQKNREILNWGQKNIPLKSKTKTTEFRFEVKKTFRLTSRTKQDFIRILRIKRTLSLKWKHG